MLKLIKIAVVSTVVSVALGFFTLMGVNAIRSHAEAKEAATQQLLELIPEIKAVSFDAGLTHTKINLDVLNIPQLVWDEYEQEISQISNEAYTLAWSIMYYGCNVDDEYVRGKCNEDEVVSTLRDIRTQCPRRDDSLLAFKCHNLGAKDAYTFFYQIYINSDMFFEEYNWNDYYFDFGNSVVSGFNDPDNQDTLKINFRFYAFDEFYDMELFAKDIFGDFSTTEVEGYLTTESDAGIWYDEENLEEAWKYYKCGFEDFINMLLSYLTDNCNLRGYERALYY